MLLMKAIPLLGMLVLWKKLGVIYLKAGSKSLKVRLWSCVQPDLNSHLQYVVMVFLQSLQVCGQSHFNELVDRCLQAPQCQLVAFLCHVSRWLPTANTTAQLWQDTCSALSRCAHRYCKYQQSILIYKINKLSSTCKSEETATSKGQRPVA